MKKKEYEGWIINLEDVSSQVDANIVSYICEKYGASCIYDLSPCDFSEVYNELFQYALEMSDCDYGDDIE